MQDHFRSDFAGHVSLQTREFWKQVRISKPLLSFYQSRALKKDTSVQKSDR
jgi:hypothetical protein